MKSIREEWDAFVDAVLPPTVREGCIQYAEMRRAFYAGAITLFANMVGLHENSRDESFNYLESLTEECKEFRLEMIREITEQN